MTVPPVIRFGIQSLDRLIGTVNGDKRLYGIGLSEPAQIKDDELTTDGLPITASVCLSGPDGSGKSVFSLHMASHYLGDCLAECLTSTARRRKCAVPRVLYISTDLTYKMALKGWDQFALNLPFERREPLVELREGRKERDGQPRLEIKLGQYFPSGEPTSEKSIINYLETAPPNLSSGSVMAEVCFVDLASRTAGDDWGFVHRLLSTMEPPGPNDPRHLVILDAVEGFETLVGDLNAFGEKSSRRSRIAQVMRLATGKCHLVFVIEEGREERFPEEFVTDVVVRLRNIKLDRYLRRTVEIEKARGQWHIRGQHPYVIRDGKGSTTGTQHNADEPEVRLDPETMYGSLEFRANHFVDVPGLAEKISRGKDPVSKYVRDRLRRAKRKLPRDGSGPQLATKLADCFNLLLRERGLYKAEPFQHIPLSQDTRKLIGGTLTPKPIRRLNRGLLEDAYPNEITRRQQSYVHVFPSLNYISRETMVDKDFPLKPTAVDRFAAFGITYLDSMLGGESENMGTNLDYDTRGLPCGTTTALIGDSLTQKSQLGRAFLSRAFYQYASRPANGRILEGESRLRKPSGLPGAHREFQPVTVMFTTQNVSDLDLVKEFQLWLKASTRELKATDEALEKYITEHTICRRFEIHDIPTPILMHIFQRNIEKAQRIMFGLSDQDTLPSDSERFKESWRIRVVIDDLNSFRNMFPEMRDDPLMLPSLLFMLDREGVTTLIIDTQTSGSPDLSITERFDSSVRQLVKHRIYTWRLPFYGENRVAISLIPPISQEAPGVIRELRWETRFKSGIQDEPIDSEADRSLRVDPHFELYAGLELGKPRPVPLEVRFYAETASFKRYVEAEERFLREMFTPVSPPSAQDVPRIIECTEAMDYDALRDSSRLQRDTRLDHTMLLQVDEFWWLRRATQRRAGAFRQQWHYLNSVTAEKKGDHFEQEAVTDPFGVFQPPGDSKATVKDRLRKFDFFDADCGYEFDDISSETRSTEQGYIDRVPFTWDFGFLLCNGKAWEEAEAASDTPLVGDVWSKLRKSNEEGEAGVRPPVSWRDFLAASKRVAEFQSYRTSTPATAFDFTMLSPEAFSCLILEMWVSEIYQSLGAAEKKCRTLMRGAAPRRKAALDGHKRHLFEVRNSIIERVGRRRWHWDKTDSDSELTAKTLLVALVNEKEESLTEILRRRKATFGQPESKPQIGGYSLELYKVWLLLIEALSFADLVDSSSHLNFEFKSRVVGPQAVSARHWYKTASKFIDSLTPEQLEYNWIPARLPGHFSVRSDWFLAVAGGSRSSRLADHALDLLSSQRANVTRLQEGIGLPTRTLFAAGSQSKLRSRLISVRKKGKPLVNVEYEELRRLGAPTSVNGEVKNEEEFYWLWRSGIWAYNRYSRIWHKWLNRTLLQWHSWRQRYGSSWTGGFEAYDLINKFESSEDKEVQDDCFYKLHGLDSWNEFHKLRDILIAELEQVSISST